MSGGGFRFRGYTRRIAASVVDAMMPRWPDADASVLARVHASVLDDFEAALIYVPAATRFGARIGLWVLEFGGPLMLTGVVPFSLMGRERRLARLQRLGRSRVVLFRELVMAYKLFVTLSAYSHPEIEAELGVSRRAWRTGRRVFRARLLDSHARRAPLPAPPQAIGADDLTSPERYLDDVPEASP